MIKSYSIKNFKNHKNPYYINFNGLTILTGTNNSGKSSILQSLRLLSIVKDESGVYTRLPFEKIKELGTFKDTLNKAVSRDDIIEYRFACDIEGFDFCSITLQFNSTLKHICKLIKDKDQSILVKMDLYFQKTGNEIQNFIFELAEDKEEILYKVITPKGYENSVIEFNGFVPSLDLFNELLTDENKRLFNLIAQNTSLKEVFRFLSNISKSKIKYLSAYRNIQATNKSTSENYLETHGQNTANIIQQLKEKKVFGENKNFGELFDYWTNRILGSKFEVIDEVDGPKIVLNENDVLYNLEQVGFGNTQIIPIIVMVLGSEKGDLLLIENPEVHLHPKWKADLADLFYFAALQGVKVIIETHSLEIINRVRVLVKNNENYKKYTNLYFFEKNGFGVNVQEIEIENTGKLSCWPENFIDKVTIEDTFKLI